MTYFNKETELVYSPDDGGYYFQRYPSGQTSQIFKSVSDAKAAHRSDELKWDD